jgi:hypothetical protein
VKKSVVIDPALRIILVFPSKIRVDTQSPVRSFSSDDVKQDTGVVLSDTSDSHFEGVEGVIMVSSWKL